MKNRKIKAKKGISLIEVVMSVALIAILLIPLGNVAMTTLKTNSRAEIKQEASQVGQSIIEELSNYDKIRVSNNKAQFMSGNLTYNDKKGTILSGNFTNIKQDKSQYNAKITYTKVSNASLSDTTGSGLKEYLLSKSLDPEGLIKISGYDRVDKKYEITKVKYEDKSFTEDGNTKISKNNNDDPFILKVNKNAYYFYKKDNSISDDDDKYPTECISGSIVNTSADVITIVIQLSAKLDDKKMPNIPINVENNLGIDKKVEVIIAKEIGSNGNVTIGKNNDKGIVSTVSLSETGDIKLGSLYKINVEVTKVGDTEVLFKTQATKNIKFIS